MQLFQKQIYGSGITTLIISNEEMEDIMKIVKTLEVSGVLVKGIKETIKNEKNKNKRKILFQYYLEH